MATRPACLHNSSTVWSAYAAGDHKGKGDPWGALSQHRVGYGRLDGFSGTDQLASWCQSAQCPHCNLDGLGFDLEQRPGANQSDQ